MDLQQNGILEPKIIYEDNNFLALNKPAGLIVHGTVHSARCMVHGSEKRKSRSPNRALCTMNHEPTLVGWLLEKYPEIKKVGDDPTIRPGIVHRLDKETSGVMLVARTQEYFEYLKSLFGGRQIKKTYLALVFGKLEPKEGVIEKPIGIKNGTIKRSVHSEKMAKEAITAYKVVATYHLPPTTYLSLVEVEPKTGRTHQIRVHLASIGHSIVGDKLYGPKKPPTTYHPPPTRLMLHALSLEFMIEAGKRMRFEAEPPEEFLRTISGLTPD